jgi:hypothetical protein
MKAKLVSGRAVSTVQAAEMWFVRSGKGCDRREELRNKGI